MSEPVWLKHTLLTTPVVKHCTCASFQPCTSSNQWITFVHAPYALKCTVTVPALLGSVVSSSWTWATLTGCQCSTLTLGTLTHMIWEGSMSAAWLHLKVNVARVPSSEAWEEGWAGVVCMRCAILKVASSRYSAKPADRCHGILIHVQWGLGCRLGVGCRVGAGWLLVGVTVWVESEEFGWGRCGCGVGVNGGSFRLRDGGLGYLGGVRVPTRLGWGWGGEVWV